MKIYVIDLFCGGGGFSRGFEMEGFHIVLGIDNFPPCVKTFSYNFPRAVVLCQDVKEVTYEDIIRHLRHLEHPPQIIIGGPPCEPFTPTNFKRKPDPLDRLYVDPIGQLVLHFIRIVGDLQPDIFIMENVVDITEGPLKDALIREFKRIGFDEIYFNVLRAEDYGTPSCRKRVFISNIPLKPEKYPRKVTVIEAIGDLPSPYSIHDIPNHEPIPLSPKKERRIAKLKWGESLIKYRGARGTYKNYVRLHPYKPAPTVMGSSRFIHPFENRLLTVREQARLMGFPDYHVFFGGRDTQFDQVGEAVPVPLARAIARYIKEKYFKVKI